MSDQRNLFDYLTRHPPSNPIGFETWLSSAAQAALGLDAIEAERLATGRKAQLWGAFAKYDNDLRARGCASAFRIVDERSRIFGAPTRPVDAPISAMILQSDRCSVLRWIDGLNDRKFEYLGAAMAVFLGASQYFVTEKKGDGGVDFYALVPNWGASVLLHSPRKYIRMVGQSKYYQDTVQVDQAKLMVKTVEDIRTLTIDMAHRLPTWFVAGKGPIVGVMVAPFGFQSGAVSQAHSNGIMLADSVEVAESIILSRRYKRERGLGRKPTDILGAAMLEVGWKEP